MDEPRNEDSMMRHDEGEDNDMGDTDEDAMEVVEDSLYQLTSEEEQKRENDVGEMICELTDKSDSYPDIHARVADISKQMVDFTRRIRGNNLSNCVELKTRVEEMVKSQSDLMKKIPHWTKRLKEVDDEHKGSGKHLGGQIHD